MTSRPGHNLSENAGADRSKIRVGMEQIQVEPEHYAWNTYNEQWRWASYWHQIDEVLRVSPTTCLEVGIGTGDVRAALTANGVNVTVVDIDDRLGVDRAGTVTALPCKDNEFEVALCCQVLEHLPWEEVDQALAELARVSSRRVVVSVPQSGRTIRLKVEIPVLGGFEFLERTPGIGPYRFDGQHYWQVGAKGQRRSDVRAAMAHRFHIESEYMVKGNPYHRFYVMVPR